MITGKTVDAEGNDEGDIRKEKKKKMRNHRVAGNRHGGDRNGETQSGRDRHRGDKHKNGRVWTELPDCQGSVEDTEMQGMGEIEMWGEI